MSQEIIYTSSPQGLRPGSFGFCTVATTAGMASSLAERLESLSGYRHVHPPGSPQAVNNPVVHSHLILKVGGQRLHVLSRVADAGFDYSQRTNKLAHHVALEASELVPAGPAWLLAQPGFMETAWQGSPRVLRAGRHPAAGEISRGICTAWQRAAGDAGWAGALAQVALNGTRPAYLIFPPGLDPLPLIVEAQSLLPAARRWEVSFSTFFTRLPPGVDCQWRCVLAGSPEAQAAEHLRGDLVIDLTKPLGTPPDGALVEVARTGNFPVEPEPPALASRHAPAVALPSPMQPTKPARRDAGASELRLAPPAAPAARHDAYGPPELVAAPPLPTALASRRGFPLFRWAGLALALLLLVAAAGAGGYYLRDIIAPSTAPQASGLSEESLAANASGEPGVIASQPEGAPSSDTVATKQPESPASIQSGSAAPTAAPMPTKRTADNDNSKSAASKTNAKSNPSDEHKSQSKHDSPKAESQSAKARVPHNGSKAKAADYKEAIAKIAPNPEVTPFEEGHDDLMVYVLKHLPLEEFPPIKDIALVGSDFKRGSLTLTRQSDRSWEIVTKLTGGEVAIAKVSIPEGEQQVSLQWLNNGQIRGLLQYCSLQITFDGGDTAVVNFSQPNFCAAIELNGNLAPSTVVSENPLVSMCAAIQDRKGIELNNFRLANSKIFSSSKWRVTKKGTNPLTYECTAEGCEQLVISVKLAPVSGGIELEIESKWGKAFLTKANIGRIKSPLGNQLEYWDQLANSKQQLTTWEDKLRAAETESKEAKTDDDRKSTKDAISMAENQMKLANESISRASGDITLNEKHHPMLKTEMGTRFAKELLDASNGNAQLEFKFTIVRRVEIGNEHHDIEIATFGE